MSVTEYPEDRNLQVEVIIEIDLQTDTERAANLIYQFEKWIINSFFVILLFINKLFFSTMQGSLIWVK